MHDKKKKSLDIVFLFYSSPLIMHVYPWMVASSCHSFLRKKILSSSSKIENPWLQWIRRSNDKGWRNGVVLCFIPTLLPLAFV